MSRVYDFGLGGQFPDSSTKILLYPNGALLYPNGSFSLGYKISDGITLKSDEAMGVFHCPSSFFRGSALPLTTS